MTRRNRIALALALLAAALAVAWALQPRAVAVDTAAVARGRFEQVVADDGRTRVRDRYVIAAPLAGRVERIRLLEGDPVKHGQTVALLTPTAPALLDERAVRELQERVGAAEAQLARARAETARIRAQRDQARADFERTAKLAEEGFVSRTAREQADLALRTAERAVDAARAAEEAAGHEVAQAKAALTRFRGGGTPATRWEVTSPVNGVVLKVVQRSEAPVPLGAPLLEVADTRSLEAVVDVLSQEAVAIAPGMPARLHVGRGLTPLAARVRLVEPAAFTKVSALGVEEQRVNVVLDFVEPLERLQPLGDAFRVEAEIVTFRAEDAVTVPVGALFRAPEGWAAFVVEEGRARLRPVSAPRRSAEAALVDEGLRPGEEVVLYPSDALRDGARVERRGR
ncbi:MAG TPA: HlyD family efflux transporter periplasmic adaptor subunit [Burkholderiales bacterium]|nr:HlyD family efflux transporter periplasmic adaptor subunit [Burkholderiales bacterium]